MFLHISDKMTIEEIQDRFTECFPGLKIAFYNLPETRIYSLNKAMQLDKRSRVENVRRYHYNGVLEIKSWYTADRVERELKDLFDLNARIFRTDARDSFAEIPLAEELTLKQ